MAVVLAIVLVAIWGVTAAIADGHEIGESTELMLEAKAVPAGAVDLTWSGVDFDLGASDVTTYTVQASLETSFSPLADEVEVSATDETTTTVSWPGSAYEGQTVYFQVKASNDSTTTAWSNMAMAVPDATAPMSDAVFDPEEPAESGWYLETPTVTIEASDTVSGVHFVEWSLNDGPWQAGCASCHDGAEADPFEVTGIVDGEHTLEYRAVDVAGNVETTQGPVPFKVDTMAPEIDVDLGDYDPAARSGDPVEVTASAMDATSGLASLSWLVLPAGSPVPGMDAAWETTTTVAAVDFDVEDEGSWDIYVAASDVAGNMDWKKESVTIYTALTGDVDLMLGAKAVAAGMVDLTWSGVDFDLGASGVTTYTVEASLETSFSPLADEVEVPATDETTTTVSWDGSAYEGQMVYFRVMASNDDTMTAWSNMAMAVPDATAPTSEAIFVPADPAASGWYLETPTITIEATDTISGVHFVQWSLNGGEWQAGCAASGCHGDEDIDPFQVTGIVDGVHTLEYRAVDLVGNVEVANVESIWVDTEGPDVDFDAGEFESGGWTNEAVHVSVAATDTVSGFAQMSYGVFEASVEATSGMEAVVTTDTAEVDVHLMGEGQWKVWVWAWDNAGNKTEATFAVNIDMAAPSSDAIFDPEDADGEMGWYVTTPTVTIEATDALSGVHYVQWSLNEGPWQAGCAASGCHGDEDIDPFEVTGIVDGEHTLEYRAVDVAGNVETTQGPVPFKVDTTAPVTTSNAVDEYFDSAEITLSVVETGSGFAATYYSLNDGPDMTYTDPIVIDVVGDYALQFWSVDVAGNVEAPNTATFEIVSSVTPPPTIVVAGIDRFHTAVEVSRRAFPAGSDYVVIASGRNWPDALAGTALAGALDAPILLVEPGSVPTVTGVEIGRLGATKAIILGGTGAVGTPVSSGLANAGLTVERIGGLTRYETADMIAIRVKAELGEGYDGMALVATGGDFPDAIAAAPLAAGEVWPLFLAHPTSGLSAGTKSAMAGVQEAVILGGTGAVSPAVAADLATLLGSADDVTRLGGLTRYDTAVKIAEYAVDMQGFMWDRVGITTGQDFPDALTGGVLQGQVRSVMLLTPPTSLHPATAAALEANKAEIDTVTYFGGTGAVSQAVRNAIALILQ